MIQYIYEEFNPIPNEDIKAMLDKIFSFPQKIPQRLDNTSPPCILPHFPSFIGHWRIASFGLLTCWNSQYILDKQSVRSSAKRWDRQTYSQPVNAPSPLLHISNTLHICTVSAVILQHSASTVLLTKKLSAKELSEADRSLLNLCKKEKKT